MSGSNYLLDTCFILGLCNQNPEVLNTFGDIPISRCYISVITRIELLGYANITTEDEAFLQSVLSEITCLSLSDDVEEGTIQLRKHHKVKLPDAIILATAKVNTLELLTLDKVNIPEYIVISSVYLIFLTNRTKLKIVLAFPLYPPPL